MRPVEPTLHACNLKQAEAAETAARHLFISSHQTVESCDLFLLHQQYETTDKHLSPDGQYVPRIIFVGENMKFVRNSKSFWLDLLMWLTENSILFSSLMEYGRLNLKYLKLTLV